MKTERFPNIPLTQGYSASPLCVYEPWWLCVYVGIVTSLMVPFLDGLAEWFAGLELLWQTLIGGLLLAASTSLFVYSATFCVWVGRRTKRAYNTWWTRRALRKPREEELGFHDHQGRIKRLYVRLSYLRGDVYDLLTAIGKITEGADKKKDSAPAKYWVALARKLEPKVKTLEAAATEMGAVTTLMMSSFKVVCERSQQASLDALKLFTENDPATLQWQMKEDFMVSIQVRLFLNDLSSPW